MIPGVFILKIDATQWRMCVVKQDTPSRSNSGWLLLGRHKHNRNSKSNPGETFQMEFKSHQEVQMINHILNLSRIKNGARPTYAETGLTLIAQLPAAPRMSIASLWTLKGIEMYRNQFRVSNLLADALYQDVYMLSLTPQISQSSQLSHPSLHPMQTRSKQYLAR